MVEDIKLKHRTVIVKCPMCKARLVTCSYAGTITKLKVLCGRCHEKFMATWLEDDTEDVIEAKVYGLEE